MFTPILCGLFLFSHQDASLDKPWISQFVPGKSNPISGRPQWEEERHRIRLGMVEAFGWPGDPKLRPPLKIETLTQVDEGAYWRRKIRYAVEWGPGGSLESVPAWLLIPKGIGAGQRRPAALCLHQTNGALGKDEPVGLGGLPHLHLAKELALRGWVCLAPDYPSFGEYAYDWKKNPYASGSIKAVTNNLRGVDLLVSLPEVDSTRIAAVGHSLGGHNALFTAAFEPRLAAVVTSCGFTRMARYYNGDLKGWTSDRYVPRIRDRYGLSPAKVPFDMPGILALTAPSVLFVNAPVNDDNFQVLGVKETMEQVQPLYQWLGVPSRVKASYPVCGHDFPDDVRKEAWEFLESHLGAPK